MKVTVGVFKVKSVEKNCLMNTLSFHVSLAHPRTANLPLLYFTIPYFFSQGGTEVQRSVTAIKFCLIKLYQNPETIPKAQTKYKKIEEYP